MVCGYARVVKNGFVTFFISIEETCVNPMRWLNGIQTASSSLLLLNIVRSRVCCENSEAARSVTRV